MTVPVPPSRLACSIRVVRHGEVLHRIHDSRFTGTSFNPGLGSSRFAPFTATTGLVVPTSYTATDFACAAFETVFHDVEHDAPIRSVAMTRIEMLHYSILALNRDLRLARLFEPDLNRWGVSRADLIHAPPPSYPGTRRWATAIHASDPMLDGLIWTSRKNDEAQAMLLFGDRVAEHDLALRTSERISTSPRWLGELQELAKRAGITLTL